MGETRRGGAPGLWARAHIERCQRRAACARSAPEEWATWPHVGARAGTLSPQRGGTHRDSLGDATFDVRFVNYVNTKEGRTKVNERLRIGLLPWQVIDDNLASAVQQSQACGRAQARRPPRDHEDAALDLRPRGAVSPESSQDSRARASLSPPLSPVPPQCRTVRSEAALTCSLLWRAHLHLLEADSCEVQSEVSGGLTSSRGDHKRLMRTQSQVSPLELSFACLRMRSSLLRTLGLLRL